MQRFSISKAMAAVALVAANCAAVRALLPRGSFNAYSLFIIGLLPLINAQIIGLYLIASRYRVLLRRRTQLEQVGFAPAFAGANSLALLITSITVGVTAPDRILGYMEYVLKPVDVFFRSWGVQAIYETSFFQFVAWPLFFGAALSGPPLVFALIFGWLSNRYRFVIIPRRVPALMATQAAADPGETASHDDAP